MIQPVPTPISNTFPLDCSDKKAMIFSTNSSVSGLGIKQGKAVQQLFKQYCPNREVSIHKDLSGNDRIIIVGGRK